MHILFISLFLFSGQMDSLQQKTVVRLPPSQRAISLGYNGKLLELINTATVISLPVVLPRLDAPGIPWSIDVKNMGPQAVTITGKGEFSMQVNVGQTVHIDWNGKVYSSPGAPRH